MSKSPNQKLKIIRIYEMLLKDSDASNPITTSYMLQELENQGIACERKSLADDLYVLMQFDPEIKKIPFGKGYGYYIDRKELNLYEIRLLLDMVQSASFLTVDQTKLLASGIASFAGARKGEIMARNTIVFDKTKHSNNEVADSIETIEKAIGKEMKISFQYARLRFGKVKEFRNGGERYVVNPVALIYKNDYYYLLSYKDGDERYTVFRVDRMFSCKEEVHHCTANLCKDSVDSIKDCLTAFGMWLGESVAVKLLVDDRYSNEIFDKFGEDVYYYKADDAHHYVIVHVSINDHFLSWVSMFGSMIRIVEPASAVADMKRYLFKRFCIEFFGVNKDLSNVSSKELDGIAELMREKAGKLPDKTKPQNGCKG